MLVYVWALVCHALLVTFHFSSVEGNQEIIVSIGKTDLSGFTKQHTPIIIQMEVSNSESHFECGACGANFPSLSTLRAHKKEHHESHDENRFFCSSCEKYFTTIHLLKNHSRTHLSRKCLSCDFVCNSALQLKQRKKNFTS